MGFKDYLMSLIGTEKSPYRYQQGREIKVGCSICGKECEPGIDRYIILNNDGDYVCSEECERKHNEEKDHFFNNILPNDGLFADWMGVPRQMVSGSGVTTTTVTTTMTSTKKEPVKKESGGRYRILKERNQ